MTSLYSHAQVVAGDSHEPKAHAASHESGGSDEIDVTGLTGAGATIDFGEDADITTLDYDDVADAGATGEVADAGHRHGMPSAAGGASPTAATASATVATDESTSSTSYVDLSTSGPSVTVTVNTACLVIVTSRIYGAGGYGRASFVASGANTVAVSDVNAFGSGLSTNDVRGSATTHLTGLTPGSTTFKMQYKALSSGTPHFLDRNIIVVPLD